MLTCQWIIGWIIHCYFISFREPLHVIWYYCTWWTRAPSTERGNLKSSTLSMTNWNFNDGAFYINHFPNLDHHIHRHISLMLCVTGETGPNPRMGRQGTGRGNPGNQLQRKGLPTPSKTQRTLRPLWDCLPPRRASYLWTNGVPPFHATQDSDTLPFSLPKVQSQSIISLSLHTIKFAGRARQITCSGLGYIARGWAKSQTDVHFSPTGTTAGMPLAWVMLALSKRNVNVLCGASGPGRWRRNTRKGGFR